ncbi:MAG: hypothetical protein LUD39_02995, partial [Opitutae bacterium]|nr:hypothetical protein [Opitutae bacterium]
TWSPPANLAGESRIACARLPPPPTYRNKPESHHQPATTDPTPPPSHHRPKSRHQPISPLTRPLISVRDVSPEQIRVTTIVAGCRHHQPIASPPTQIRDKPESRH